MRKKKVKFNFDIPRCIIKLPGSNMFYNSSNGDRIHESELEKYVTGKDPVSKSPVTAAAAAAAADKDLKDEFIRSKRWDLNTDN